MGMMEEETLNIGKCHLSDFFMDLKGQLSLVSGLIPLPDDITLEDVRRPMLVIGKPGIGKTCGILSILNELNEQLPEGKKFGMKKILLGQTIVGELSGVDVINPADGSMRKSQSPNLPRVEKDGEYGVLFLDEITTADEAQIQPALGLADDTRSIGEYTLPEHWIVVAAGNGPDCANFIKMDDMTLTRFQAYDVLYDYKKDWRPWAHANGIDPLIIAYLNFKPTAVVDVVSTEMDKAGKMFACPRTWTRLSTELKIRKAQNRPVSQAELYSFSSRIIGEKAAKDFSSFAAFQQKIDYDVEKIVDGTERDPNGVIAIEAYHILIQGITKTLQAVVKSGTVSAGEFTEEVYIKVGNALTWIIKLEKFMLEQVLNGIVEIREEVPNMSSIMLDDDFIPYCPSLEQFIANHCQALSEVLAG